MFGIFQYERTGRIVFPFVWGDCQGGKKNGLPGCRLQNTWNHFIKFCATLPGCFPSAISKETTCRHFHKLL